MSSHNKASSLTEAVLNCSTAAEAGNITQEIDDWFGGMSLSASISAEEGGGEEKEKQHHNNDDHHDVDGNNGISLSGSEGSTDLDNLISEANGFLECVVSEEENVDTIVYFGFHEDNNAGGDKGDDVASAGVNSDDIESELKNALQLAQGFTKFLTHHDSDEGSTSPVASNAVDENCGWGGDNHEEKEERHDEGNFVRELALDEAAGEGEEGEEQEEEEEETDWEGWNKNNDFFASFDEEEEVVSQIDEPEVEPQKEYTPHRSVEAPKSETKCIKPKLRVHIKGAPQVLPQKEEKEPMFFAASQPSPLARDDEQLLDTNDVESMVMPSPVSVESEKSPKKFGLRISERGGGSQESEEKSVEVTTSQEDEFASFTQRNKPKETKKNVPNTPPKLTVYIKGAPQFKPSRHVQEDAFYIFQPPSPVFGDDKRLLSSSSFAASPSMTQQKNEKTSTSTTKKHFRNFVGKSLPVPKYQATTNNKKGNSLNSLGDALNTFNDESENQGFDNDNFFFAAPASPVRQAKDAMRDGCSTKKKIFGLLSGKKKKSKGLYLLDD